MTRQPRTVWIIVLAGVALRLFLIFELPLYPARTYLPGYNDEPMHLNYVRHLVEVGTWPVWSQEESASTNLVDEFPQPPLYYLCATPLYSLFESLVPGGGLYGARLTSLFFGVIAALVIYWIGKRLLHDRRGAVATLAFAMFTPNAVMFSSLVTNDSMLLCFASMAFAGIILVREGFDGTIRQAKTGLFLGIAVCSKMSALALIPLIWFAGKHDWRPDRVRQARLRLIVIAILVVMPLFVWNIAHYGQVVPMVSIYTPENTGHLDGPGILHPIDATLYLARTSAQPLEQVWGSIPEKVTTSAWLLFMSGLFLLGLWLTRQSESRWFVFVGLMLPVIALIYYNIRFYQAEARLLAPAFAPLAVIIGAGMRRLNIPTGWQCVIWGSPLLMLAILSLSV